MPGYTQRNIQNQVCKYRKVFFFHFFSTFDRDKEDNLAYQFKKTGKKDYKIMFNWLKIELIITLR